MSESWERSHLCRFSGRFVCRRDVCVPRRGRIQLKTAISFLDLLVEFVAKWYEVSEREVRDAVLFEERLAA
jgi:hypothetical protein